MYEEIYSDWEKHPMRMPRLAKVVVNMGVGTGGEKLSHAETIMEKATAQKPTKTLAKVKVIEWDVKEGSPLGCKVTLLGGKARAFVKDAFNAVENTIHKSNFDDLGNLSFGVKEYIDMPKMKYDPSKGMFGFDVCLTIERPGYRIKRRKIMKRKIPAKHKLTKEEAIAFITKEFGVKVE